MSTKRGIDGIFLTIVLTLVIVGLFIFSSASLGLLARDGARLSAIAYKQVIIGIVGGFSALFVFSRIHYKTWRKAALPLFIVSLTLTALVFAPKIGFSSGGAHRWIHLGFITFQPSELLKLGFVVYLAAILSAGRRDMSSWTEGLLPFLSILGMVSILLLKQPDTGTLMVFVAAGSAMYFAAGGSWKHFLAMIMLGVVALAGLVYMRPYVKERITTFLDPSQDTLGSSYQIQQALIAIGSGKSFGRGFGQSVQKFSFLPEPIGDSIFAVAAEEFGFTGSIAIIALFILFTLRGLKIAAQAPDMFSMLLATGIVMHIAAQSFINIAAMLGLIPLTGVPLMFISHGGTALLIGLCEIGILLNISKYRARTI